MSTKTCYNCHQIKPIEQFKSDGPKPYTYKYICKVCNAQQAREWYHKNKQRALARMKQYNADHPLPKHPKQVRRIQPDGTLKCTQCKQFLPIDLFHKDKMNPTGKHYNCKSCNKRITQERRARYPHIRKYPHRHIRHEELKQGKLSCSKCKQTKPIEEFPKDKARIIGYHSHCKLCKYAGAELWRHRKAAEKQQ